MSLPNYVMIPRHGSLVIPYIDLMLALLIEDWCSQRSCSLPCTLRDISFISNNEVAVISKRVNVLLTTTRMIGRTYHVILGPLLLVLSVGGDWGGTSFLAFRVND